MTATNWQEWEIEHADELTVIEQLKEEGHTRHCACRQVWGDCVCECGQKGRSLEDRLIAVERRIRNAE